MIYFTNLITPKQKKNLTTYTAAVPLPDDHPYQNEHCMVLDKQKQLYYIYPSDNEPYNRHACGCVGFYTYKDEHPYEYNESGEIDVFENGSENHIWENITNTSVIIITDVVLDNPEELLENDLEHDFKEVYDVLQAVKFFDKPGKQSTTTDTLQTVITSLCENILAEDEAKHAQTVTNILHTLNSTNLDFKNPETFHCMIAFELETLLQQIADKLHEQPIVPDQYKASFVFLHYNFMESHINELIQTKTHTSCCISDKSRFILKHYLSYTISGKTEDFMHQTEHHYWVPTFGTTDQWIAYCDGIYRLYYGKTSEYLTPYKELLDAPTDESMYRA